MKYAISLPTFQHKGLLPKRKVKLSQSNDPKTLHDRIVMILIAAGFSEVVVAFCICRLREEGIQVKLVSMTAGLVPSFHGLIVRPDWRLSQLKQLPDLLVFPGEARCVSNLIATPGLRELVDATLSEGGSIAVAREAQTMLEKIGLFNNWNGQQLFYQDQQTLSDFVTSIINHLLV